MKKIIFIVFFFFCITCCSASIVIMDADSGRILYSENENKKMLIASTTKIMTTLVALENANINDYYIVGDEISTINGSMIYVKKGEKISLESLLYGLLLVSGNDAAMVIANNVMQYDNFINRMNLKAIELGMDNTIFENPHGLNDDSKNYSSAKDLAILMKYAIKNKEFLKISGTKKYKVSTNKSDYIWYNKNKLLSTYKYSVSGKIGYTRASGQVYVSNAKKNNVSLIIASINEPNKFELHKKLYEEYFKKYKKYKIIDKYNFSINDNNYKKYYFFINNDVNVILSNKEISKIKIKAQINAKMNDNIAGSLNIYLDSKIIKRELLYFIDNN